MTIATATLLAVFEAAEADIDQRANQDGNEQSIKWVIAGWAERPFDEGP